MQTNFNALQLGDPTIARADEILRRCVHCGLCTATCPTYVLTGDERDSPRGRIYLMKQMFEGRDVTPSTVYHIDRCLSCLGCMTTCPSGVDYMHLVDLARVRIEQRGHRGTKQRLTRWFLSRVLPNPNRFKPMLVLGWFAKPFRNVFAKMGMRRTAAALALVPPGALKLKISEAEIGLQSQGAAAEARGDHAGLRAGGAGPADQSRRHPAAPASRRRRHGGQGRRLLRRALPSSRPGGGGAGPCAPQYRCLDRGHARAPARRHRRHRRRLRHHAQGLRQSARPRPRLCRARGICLRACPRRHRVPRRDRPQSAGDVDRPEGRLSRRLLAPARPEARRAAARAAGAGRLHADRHPRGASVLRLGRHLQPPSARAVRPIARRASSRTSNRSSPTSSSPAISAA